jgi:hypothetical protein
VKKTFSDRFWKKVDKTPGLGPNGDCWLWTSATDQHGYGAFSLYGRGKSMPKAHRLSYEWAYGPLPLGIDVLHKCDNPPCVRPEHLFTGTARDNMRDASRKGRLNPKSLKNLIPGISTPGIHGGWALANSLKTHCSQGHPYDEKNTCFKKGGGRSCRACSRDYYHRHKGEEKSWSINGSA